MKLLTTLLLQPERVGMGDTVPTRITAQALDGRLDVISEPLTAYRDAGVFGHRIATPTLQVQVLRPAESRVLSRNRHFDVGLFGAIELQLLQGPVFVEYDDGPAPGCWRWGRRRRRSTSTTRPPCTTR